MKPGEKYILEIERTVKTPSGEIGFVKGFKTLVFDGYGLSVLKQFDEEANKKAIEDAYKRGWDESRAKLPSAQGAIDDAYKRGWNECAEKIQNIKDAAYQNGLDDAWKIARFICMRPCDGGMGMEDMEKVFGSSIVATIFHVNASVSNVMGKIRALEKEKTEIHIGDEVRFGGGGTFIVTHISSDEINGHHHYSGIKRDGLSAGAAGNLLEKTGRHVDVSTLLSTQEEDGPF